MSHSPQQDVGLFNNVVDELREVFVERGHRVEKALKTDPAFGSGRSRAALTCDLVTDTVSGSASRVGLDFRSVNGSGREFRTLSGGVDRRYRLRRARRQSDGTLRIRASTDSALATEQGSFFGHEQWAFAWTISAEGLIDETLIAEIEGFVEGSPGYLKLGPEIALGGGGGLPSGGFRPADEGLEGFDDDEDEGEDAEEDFGPSAS